MFSSLVKKIGVAALLAALCLGSLVGCQVVEGDTAAEEQSKNNQYMSEVNQSMEDLRVGLEQFNDAVTRGDVVSMRTQSENAYKAIDKLSSIEAPEKLQGIKDKYVEGCNDLKTSLDSYVQLYSDIDSATANEPFDWSSYDQRLEEIKTSYESGIQKLEEADKEAVDQP